MIFFCFFDYGDRYAGYFTVPVVFNLFFLSYIIFCTW